MFHLVLHVISFTQNTLKSVLKALLYIASLQLIACGGFEANQHPDDLFHNGSQITDLNGLNAYLNLNGKNPMFRKAEVTTQSSALRVKTQPSITAPSPKSGPGQLNKGQIIHVYWPTDISNNHIKVYVGNSPAWVSYKSGAGRQYVTLLEDASMPSISLPGSVSLSPSTRGSAKPSDVSAINLPSSAISEAQAAIRAVALTPSDIQACHFNPLVGNSNQSNNCYNRIVLSQNFKNFIAQHGYACAQEASRKAFGLSAQKILFHSSYAGQVRRNRRVSGSSKKSTHATGQALDLFAVSLYFPGQKSRRITLHKNQTDGSSTVEKQNHSFYWSYVNCWRSRVRTNSPCNCDNTKAGAITYSENSAHYNHIHISLPFCERSRYNVSCV